MMTKAKTRGNGEGSIYKQTDGLWAASITLPDGLDGKRRRKVVRSKDKRTVIKKLRDYQNQVAKHGDIPTGNMTVEKWLTHWLDDIAPLKVRPKTLAGNRSVIEGHIIPEIGKVRLEKLTAQHVRKVHKRITSTPKAHGLRGKTDLPKDTVMLSSTYALNAHNILSAALKVALREGRILHNPCELIDAPRKRLAERAALTTEDAIRLLAHLATRDDRALWAAYLLTGARRGELLGLESDRVTDRLDLSWQLQRIQDIKRVPVDYEYRHLQGTLYLTRPKSRAGWRIVPLVEPLKSIMYLHMAGRPPGLVFTRDGRPWDPDAASDEWKAVLAEAGLPDDVVLHGARHTTVDLLFAAGVTEAVIMEIVGHSTRAVTRGYRSRGNMEQLELAMNRMSGLVLDPPKK